MMLLGVLTGDFGPDGRSAPVAVALFTDCLSGDIVSELEVMLTRAGPVALVPAAVFLDGTPLSFSPTSRQAARASTGTVANATPVQSGTGCARCAGCRTRYSPGRKEPAVPVVGGRYGGLRHVRCTALGSPYRPPGFPGADEALLTPAGLAFPVPRGGGPAVVLAC